MLPSDKLATSTRSQSTLDSLLDSDILNETGIKELDDSDPSCIQWIHPSDFESSSAATSSISIQEVSLESFANGDSVFEPNPSFFATTAFIASSSSITTTTTAIVLHQEIDEDEDVYVESTPPIAKQHLEQEQSALRHDVFFSSDMDSTDEILGDGVEPIDELDGNVGEDEEIPSSVQGDDVQQQQLNEDDGDNEEFEEEFEAGKEGDEEGEKVDENEELSEDELDAFALVRKLNVVAAESTETRVVFGDGDAVNDDENDCFSEDGEDCVTDSLAGDEQQEEQHADMLVETNEGIHEQVSGVNGISERDNASIPFDATTSVVQERLSTSEPISSSTKHASNNINQESSWESIYNSFRETSYSPSTPSTPVTLPLQSRLEDNNDAASVISIPLSKDGTFNESDHPTLSKESLKKVHAALASCRQKGEKFPKRITITRERVKKGAGVGGILKKTTSRNKTVLSTVWNPLKSIWSGFGFSSKPVERDLEMVEND
ncbi:UNVERIFIED_CONTAM: hypothetical protein HDU68_012877 [Siphonaria sp. JEL0065]|nr:hypothetical protein HDU68_012877 [Siphonaria sp. JEL0065]